MSDERFTITIRRTGPTDDAMMGERWYVSVYDNLDWDDFNRCHGKRYERTVYTRRGAHRWARRLIAKTVRSEATEEEVAVNG